MTQRTTRRDFLKHTTLAAGAAAGTQLVGGPYLMAGPAPSRTLNVAVVGGGGMGGYAVGQARNERFVALVEIDDGRIAEILKGLDKKQGPAEGLLRLSQDDRGVPQGHRRGAGLHAGPPPCPGGHPRDPPRQARLLPEAAGPQHLRVPRPGRGRQAEQGPHADGQPGPLRRRLSPPGRVHLGRGHRQRHRDAQHLRPRFRRQRRHPARQADSQGLALGRVARPRSLSPVSRRPAPLLVAELAAVRHGHAWATWPAT